MLYKGEHSAILLTFIKLPFYIKIFLSVFVRPLKAGFTVSENLSCLGPAYYFKHIVARKLAGLSQNNQMFLPQHESK